MSNSYKPDPLDMLAALMPGGIELQEALGQRRLVASSQLPTDGLNGNPWGRKSDVRPQAYLESLGFEFGEVDDIFINVNLPEGWKIEATEHSMWSELIDPQGRNRAGIFYKAAFYDRSAKFTLDRRFSYGRFYESDENYVAGEITSYVKDGDDIVFTTQPKTYDKKHSDMFFAQQDEASAEAISWLVENYPDWENPMAYWND